MPDAARILESENAIASHAEVDHVWVGNGRVVVTGEVVGRDRRPGPSDAVLVARERGGGREIVAAAALDTNRFSGALDLSALAGGETNADREWDLFLRVEGIGQLRLARRLDDIREKKDVLVFPPTTIGEGTSARRVEPYYTGDNALAVRSKTAAPAHEQPRAPAKRAKKGAGGRRLSRRERVLVSLASGLRPLAVRFLGPPRNDRAARSPVSRAGRMKISFVIMHAYGMGGTIRSVLDFAGYLSREHDVEVVSVLRKRRHPFFRFPPGVTVTSLDDRTEELPVLRRRLRSVLERVPSILVNPEDFPAFRASSLWTDVLLAAKLRSLEPGVLITTRAALNLIAAELAPPTVVTVGQEWMNFRAHRPGLADAIRRTYGKLDALSVLTHADLRDYGDFLGGRTRVVRIPNARSELEGGVSRLDSKLVVAAGRLTPQKGFDLLIPAFARVVERQPDWTLRIYGDGQKRNALRRLVFEHDLYNNVALMGRTQDFGAELAKASVFALSSRYEGMPGVVLEAMSKGIPVVSFDGPTGTGDIITSGHDGLLVPNGDVEAFADALLELIEDEEKRRRIGAAGLETARRYELDVVGRQLAEFLRELTARTADGATAGKDARAAVGAGANVTSTESGR